MAKKHNQLIKIIAGVRRSGKSFLLNTIFYRHLCQAEIEDSRKERTGIRVHPFDPRFIQKVIVVKNEGLHYYTKEGFLRISLLDFLTNPDSLDW